MRTSLLSVTLFACAAAHAQVAVDAGTSVRVDGSQVHVQADDGNGNRSAVDADAAGAEARAAGNTGPASKRASAAMATDRGTRAAAANRPARHEIVGSGQHVSHECNRDDVVALTGSDNQVALEGECGTLEISGAGNVVHAAAIGKVEVTGSGNQVFWRRGKTPAFNQTGTGNRLARESD